MEEAYSIVSPVKISAKISVALSYLADATPYKIYARKNDAGLKIPLNSIIGLLWIKIDQGDVIHFEVEGQQITQGAGRYVISKIEDLLNLYAAL